MSKTLRLPNCDEQALLDQVQVRLVERAELERFKGGNHRHKSVVLVNFVQLQDFLAEIVIVVKNGEVLANGRNEVVIDRQGDVVAKPELPARNPVVLVPVLIRTVAIARMVP